MKDMNKEMNAVIIEGEKGNTPKIVGIAKNRQAIEQAIKGPKGKIRFICYRKEDLGSNLTASEMVLIFNKLTGGSIKKFETKPVGIKRLWNAIQSKFDVIPEIKPKENTVSEDTTEITKDSEKRVTKQSLLVAAIREGKSNIDALVESTGYDKKNLMSAIGILKNPKRQKNPLNIVRDKETGIYSVVAE